MLRRSGTCLRSCLVIFALVSALGVCGPALYWRFRKTLRFADSKFSCPPCICDCPHLFPLSRLPLGWPISQIQRDDTDCGRNDPDLKQEMEKQFVDLLTEELKLQEAVAEEHARHMNITFGEAKGWLPSTKEKLKNVLLPRETCEGAREKAEALLIKERKLTTTWEHRAREMGWEGE